MADEQQLSPQEFAAKIKAKYPDYANIPDTELVTKILSKHPEYKSRIREGPAQGQPFPIAPQGATTIGPGYLAPGPRMEGLTEAGRKEHPIQAKIGDVSKRAREFGDIAGQTAIMLTGETESAGAVAKAIPSASRAGAAIGAVEKAAAGEAVHLHGITEIVDRALELDSRGHTAPKVIKDLQKAMEVAPRVDAAGGAKPFLTFQQARDFYSALTKLTPEEFGRTSGKMKGQLVELAIKMGERITEAAERVGKSKELKGAMKEYERAKRIAERVEKVTEIAWKAILTGAVGGAAAKKAWDVTH